jgi:putative DNA primase/helicase
VHGTDEGIWRRLRLIPWEVTIPDSERVPHDEMDAALAEEAPGILNWIVDGARAWLGGERDEPDDVLTATRSFRGEEDVVGQFIAERCVVDRRRRVEVGALHDAFARWAHVNGLDGMSKTMFGRRMGQRGFGSDRTAGARFWTGLDMLDEHGGDAS